MTACVRADCSGHYRDDGSCEECGHVAPRTESSEARSTNGSRDSSRGGRSSDRSRSTEYARPSQRTPSRPITLGRLGEGLVDVPAEPLRDPTAALLPEDAGPPLRRQRCHQCDTPVGQPKDGRPGFTVGFCPKDGTPFSFARRLSTGDVVENRYEVLGCLAFGGLGWIYLAVDRNLADQEAKRWVVLKGLIDTADRDAWAAAQAEKRFLVEVDHPNIVKIHDFVRHPDPRTGEPVGYIVMEYLGGRSLQEILRTHRDGGERTPLPLSTVLVYGMKLLDALEYLHGKGLVYCDLKPENVLHVEDQVKLIDLGAVIRTAQPPKAFYSTPGFAAPEVDRKTGATSPSPASDLYTVGRTLAVLSFPFGGFSQQYRYRLPDQDTVGLLVEEESYYRLLRRATHEDPDQRFASAAEMREQLYGVLREVVQAGSPRPSSLFTPERQTFGTETGQLAGHTETVDWTSVPRALPSPLVDLADPNAAFLGTLGMVAPTDLVRTLEEAPERSPELLLRLVDAYLAGGELAKAKASLKEASARQVPPWRLEWYRGLTALAGERVTKARRAFESVYDALPGEPAPKLALAAAREWAGDHDRAEALYDQVWRTDPDYLSAAFGLARILSGQRRWADAIAVLDGVPDRLAQYVVAQIAAIRLLLEPRQVSHDSVADASNRLGRLDLDAERAARMAIEVLTAALGLAADEPRPESTVLGHPFDEHHVRLGLEKAYRDLAKVATDADHRSVLVDQANRVRPKTLV